ncbi:FAD-dependent oxidoreductase [Neorhodopirellula pilleata]|uniref:D-amino-acid oxidase n=1 Tax=Neorhodopirellula pilleata TaxID=2714738 RepID=A0A5C6API0_9BACT|nr:FAD-dependent oxidoreductase [Neorhodopirellula pilleata]TWU01913.1 D-amino acid dehydrogenase small subunit [Neorhodopirellula pilleata]
MNIAVIGGGVIGLSVAHRLVGFGCKVTLYSPQPIEHITSSVAAAYWGPVWIGEYDRQWAVDTLAEFQRLAALDVPGISEVEFDKWMTDDAVEALSLTTDQTHWWRDLPGIDFRIEPFPSRTKLHVDGADIAFTHRIRFRSIVARMPDYLRWLESELVSSGRVAIERRRIKSLDQSWDGFDYVVNCTGAAAKSLCADDPSTASMRLVAGHAVLVHAPGIRVARLFAGGPLVGRPVYVVPRAGSVSDVLVGGTAIEVNEPIDFREPITFQLDDQCAAVISRARQYVPGLEAVAEQARLVGLRPIRDAVRIERDSKRCNVVHCYGHGGSGMTLSWGSADRVCEIIDLVSSIT